MYFPFKGPFQFLPEFKSPCWFNVQRELRCLPYLFLIGVPKAGTTDLFLMLNLHPDFRNYVKEPQWFARYRFRKVRGIDFDSYSRKIAAPLKHILDFAENSSSLVDYTVRLQMKRWAKRIVLGKTVHVNIIIYINWEALRRRI